MAIASRPKKFRNVLSVGKIVATICLDEKGMILVDFLPSGTTLNSNYYVDTLRKLKSSIK